MRNNIPVYEIEIWCHAHRVFHNVEVGSRVMKYAHLAVEACIRPLLDQDESTAKAVHLEKLHAFIEQWELACSITPSAKDMKTQAMTTHKNKSFELINHVRSGIRSLCRMAYPSWERKHPMWLQKPGSLRQWVPGRAGTSKIFSHSDRAGRLPSKCWWQYHLAKRPLWNAASENRRHKANLTLWPERTHTLAWRISETR